MTWGTKSLKVYSDSLLIVSQLKGEFAVKESKMMPYPEVAKGKSKLFDSFLITQVPRDQNVQADTLANLGSVLRDPAFTLSNSSIWRN